MGVFDFTSIRQAIRGVADRVKEVDAEIDRVTRELDSVSNAGLAKDDMRRLAAQWVSAAASAYRRDLQSCIEALGQRAPGRGDERRALSLITHSGGTPASAEPLSPQEMGQAICALFEQQILELVAKEIEAASWSEGLNASSRATARKRLEDRLIKLRSDRGELIDQAREAGISLD